MTEIVLPPSTSSISGCQHIEKCSVSTCVEVVLSELEIEQTDSEEKSNDPPLPPDIEMMDQSEELDYNASSLSCFAGGSTQADSNLE